VELQGRIVRFRVSKIGEAQKRVGTGSRRRSLQLQFDLFLLTGRQWDGVRDALAEARFFHRYRVYSFMTNDKAELSSCIRFRFQFVSPAFLLKDHGSSRHWFTCGVPNRALNGNRIQLRWGRGLRHCRSHSQTSQ